MASSSPGNAGDSFSASLFEGMVLFPPSDVSSPPPSSAPPLDRNSQKPLDEDLFSDLTLFAPSDLSPPPPLEPHDPPRDIRNNALMSRQISTRKKKRGGVRIGYAREAPAAIAATRDTDGFLPLGLVGTPRGDHDDASSSSSSVISFSVAEPPTISSEPSPSPALENDGIMPGSEVSLPICDVVVEDLPAPVAPVEEEPPEVENPPDSCSLCEGDAEPSAAASVVISHESDEGTAVGGSEVEEVATASKNDVFILTDGNLELIKYQIAQNLDAIRETAVQVCVERKELVRRRREAAGSVSLAVERHRQLERELEAACEAEDFDKAEKVSEDLAAAEKERDELLSMLREAEIECDSIVSRMQEVLQMQILAEEEGMQLLEQFAKDAAEYADLILKDSEETNSRELDEWQKLSETLELKRLEIDVEMGVVNEACSGIETSIEQLIQDDKREQERLYKKQDALTKELKNLLKLVKLKEEEIAENMSEILQVEKNIFKVVNEFDQSKSSINVRYDILQSALSKMEDESESLSVKKKQIDENLMSAEHKRSKLVELAHTSAGEAKKCHDLVNLRKSLASPILKLQEDKMALSRIEKQISEGILMLQEQMSTAKSSLQELSSNRASILEEVAIFKQRLLFINKRIPELESEKKVAAAARNFKEAGRLAAEAKALSSEKEDVQLKMEVIVSNSAKLEDEIQNIVDKIRESEGLIESKKKEAAIAGCQRLRLVAAAARAERFTALTLNDLEEADILLKEAEAAEAKASQLLESYGSNFEDIKGQPEEQFSLSLLINLSGKRLALMASSLDIPDTIVN